MTKTVKKRYGKQNHVTASRPEGGAAVSTLRNREIATALRPPKKMNGFRIVRVEIATVAYGSFAMTLLVHFLLHTS